jgi:RHS repeat-associated protein
MCHRCHQLIRESDVTLFVTPYTSYAYDSLDRLSQVTYADSSTIAYTYDSVSRLTQLTDSIAGTITYTYDSLDRLLSEVTAQGAVSYAYDALGRRATMSVPSQSTVNYTYDNANRLTQVAQGAATVQFAYDATNRATSLTLSNGVITEYTYNTASQLVGLTYKKGANTLGNLNYEFDLAGRRSRIGGSFASATLPQVVATTSYNAANQQTAFYPRTLTYDNNGNLTDDGNNTYTWNARNKLLAISGPGVTANFQYDGRGRRISKTINSMSTGYLYDGANIAQEQIAGSPSANNLNGRVDQLFSRTDASGVTSPLSDALGSNIALADATGAVQTQYSYEPFGKTTMTGATTTNTQRYTGREDDATGLYYYRARYYSPTFQRFINEDPIGLAGGVNVYAYVQNNPVGLRDPSGLQDDGRDWSKDLAVGPYLAPPLGGRACGVSPLRFGRTPDYYAFNGSLGWGAGAIGGGAAGQFVIDRYGNSYGAPGPFYFGSPGPGCGVTAGWLIQLNKPTREELRQFLSEHTVSVGVGFVVGANLAWSPGSTLSFECGTMFPGWAITWQYDYESPHNFYFTPGMYADPVLPNKHRM